MASRTGIVEVLSMSSIHGPIALRSILCTAPHLSAIETRAPVTELACYYFPGSRAELRGRCTRPDQIHASLGFRSTTTSSYLTGLHSRDAQLRDQEMHFRGFDYWLSCLYKE